MLGPLNCDVGLDGRRDPLLLLSRGAPDMPLAAAAMAATLVTGVWLMLFLRVTRCAGFRLPADIECECGRFLGSEPAMVLDECRCWLAGRTLMDSWQAARSAQLGGHAIAGKQYRYLEDSHDCYKIEKLPASVFALSSSFVSKAAGIVAQPPRCRRL